MSDIDRATEIFHFLCQNSETMRYIVFDGEPVSKARPRFGGGGRVYTPAKQKAASDALSWKFREEFSDPWKGNIAVGCIFYRSTMHRVDVDNMMKQVLDAANTICFLDDYQVTAQAGFVELDREHPRTIIVFGRHESTMDRSGGQGRVFSCLHCGTEFRSHLRKGGRPPKFCSRPCARASTKRIAGSGLCLVCGKELSKRHYAYCREHWSNH